MSAEQRDWADASLLDYISIVWASRKPILLTVVAAALLTVLIVFLLPPTYEAETTLLSVSPSESGSILGRFGVSLEDLGVQGSSGLNSPVSYPDVLRSRRLLSQLLHRNVHRNEGAPPEPLISTLVDMPDGPKREDVALKTLRSSLSAAVDRKTGMLVIRFRSHYPMVAAEVANALDSLLVSFTIEVLATQAGTNRRFIEQRLTESQDELSKAEGQLADFRQRNVRYEASPRLAIEEGRLARALRAEEEVYLTLRRQHELARIEERKDVPSLVVLDSATRPIFKSSPKRMLITGSVVTLAGLLSAAWAIFAAMPPGRIRVVQHDELRVSGGRGTI